MNEQCIVHQKYTHYFNYLYDEVTGKASSWPEHELKLHVFSVDQWPTCKCKPTVDPIGKLDGNTNNYAGVYHNKLSEEHLG